MNYDIPPILDDDDDDDDIITFKVTDKGSPLLLLGEHLLIRIFSNIDIRDVYNLSQVNQTCAKLLRNNELWDIFYEHKYGYFPRSSTINKTTRKYDWMRECKIATNWRKRNYHDYTLKGHSGIVTGVHILTRHRKLLSCATDGNIRIWNTTKLKCISTLRNHLSYGITCFKWNGSNLFTGDMDNKISIWDLETGRVCRTIRLPKNRPLHLQCTDRMFAVGDTGGSLRLYDMRTPNPIKRQFDTKASVLRCFQFDNNKVILGTERGRVNVLDFKTGAFMRSFDLENKHEKAITCMQFGSHYCVTGSTDWSSKIWDVNSGEYLGSLEEHLLGVWCLQFDDNKIITGGGEGCTRLWDTTTDSVDTWWAENRLYGHATAVRSLHFSKNLLMTGSSDFTCKIYDFSDVEYIRPPDADKSYDKESCILG